MIHWGETLRSDPSQAYQFALPLCFGALVILPFEIPKGVLRQAHHMLRGFGLR